MVGEHTLHDFGPLKSIKACCMVCPGQCSTCTCVMSSEIWGLIKEGREHEIAVWAAFGQGCMRGKSFTVEGLPETEATSKGGRGGGNSREEGDGEDAEVSR